MTSIWNSTNTGVTSTMRIPVDADETSTPKHVTGNDLLNYIEANYSLTSNLVGTGTDSILIDGTTADKIGSIAIGKNAIASGDTAGDNYPVALGYNAQSYQLGSVAIGYNSTAGLNADESEEECVAIGSGSSATGRHAVAIGRNANGTCLNSIAIGDDASCTGAWAKQVAIGNAAIANGDRAIAIGSNAEVQHDSSIALGEVTISSADFQFTFGEKYLRLGQFTVATLGAASSYTGHVVYVSDGDSGSPCLAVSNGSNWLKVSLGSIIT